MKSTFSYFKQSLLFSLICIAFAGFLGYLSANQHASSSATQIILSYMVSAAVLGVLETSVSLDNAVVNAKYLEKMNEPSRHWFLTWGMVIAVFGMRLVLPIAIVSIAAWIDPISPCRPMGCCLMFPQGCRMVLIDDQFSPGNSAGGERRRGNWDWSR